MINDLTIAERLILLNPDTPYYELIWKTLLELQFKDIIEINKEGLGLKKGNVKALKKHEDKLIKPIRESSIGFLDFDSFKEKLRKELVRFSSYKKFVQDKSWRLATYFQDDNLIVKSIFGTKLTEKGSQAKNTLLDHIEKLEGYLTCYDELKQTEKEYLIKYKSDFFLIDPPKIEPEELSLIFSEEELKMLFIEDDNRRDFDNEGDESDFSDFIDTVSNDVDSDGSSDGDGGDSGDGD